MTVLPWDEGTTCGLFVSLYVLHRPSTYGVRPSWAAAQRRFLEKVQSVLPVPLCWLYLLPAEAKNVAGALFTLAQLPAAERLPSPLIIADTPIEVINTPHTFTLRQFWPSAVQEVQRAFLLIWKNHVAWRGPRNMVFPN